jgi:hypothetical protein
MAERDRRRRGEREKRKKTESQVERRGAGFERKSLQAAGDRWFMPINQKIDERAETGEAILLHHGVEQE